MQMYLGAVHIGFQFVFGVVTPLQWSKLVFLRYSLEDMQKAEFCWGMLLEKIKKVTKHRKHFEFCVLLLCLKCQGRLAAHRIVLHVN